MMKITKTEILCGFNSILEALTAKQRSIYRLFITKSNIIKNKYKKILNLGKELNIKYEVLDGLKINSIAKTTHHQGIAAIVSPLPMIDLENLIKKNYSSGVKSKLLVILDGILDPHNFGAIVRTSYCVGALGIIITKDRACPPTPAVSRSSAGALEHIPVCCVSNLSNTIKILKSSGFWIAGIDAVKNAQDIFTVNLLEPIVIVIGNESKGLRPLIQRHCDFLISIPMLGNLNSLNASVAAAIVLYENFRQKRTLS